MNRVIIATTLSLAVTGTSILYAGAGQIDPKKDPKIGTRVTITGCLHEGTGHGSFVLLGVTERPAGAPSPIRAVPYAIYWLDSTDQLKPFIGEIVDVTGKITARRSKLGTITVSVDPSDTQNTEVEVASSSKSEKTEKFDNDDKPKPAGTAGAKTSLEVLRPVYKLSVEQVTSADGPTSGPACR